MTKNVSKLSTEFHMKLAKIFTENELENPANRLEITCEDRIQLERYYLAFKRGVTSMSDEGKDDAAA